MVSLWCFPAGSKKGGFRRKEQVLRRNDRLSEYNENPPWVAVHPARDKSQHQLIEVRQMQGLKRGKSIWLKHFKANEKSVGFDLRNLLSVAEGGGDTTGHTGEERPSNAPPACCWPSSSASWRDFTNSLTPISLLLACPGLRNKSPRKELPSPVPASTLSASLTKAT